jgi:cellulose synthase/poly-beta-1,6-N-acetylglucosamine synthase-like glycosyltransferase
MVHRAARQRKRFDKLTLFIAAILLIPTAITAFFVVEVLAGLPRGARARVIAQDRPRAAVIIPAHDEQAVLGGTLEALNAALPPNAEILVVADNCVDDTAAVARGSGVRVVERQNPEQRGKGFALDFARSVLAAAPPDVVVVIDADCAIAAESLAALVNAAAESGRPCQSINLLRASPMAPPMVQISTFAFMLKNVVRQRGLQRLAGRVHLTGTGMALPWTHFAGADLATSSIVEDIRLGFELAEADAPPQLVEQAVIWSNPATQGGTLVQRRRWEGGFLQMARRVAPAAMWRALRRLDARGVAAALDLCVPPLALLGLVDGALLAAAVVLTLVSGASWWPVLVLLGVIAGMASVVLLAWAREGRAFLTPRVLLRLPLYMLWKVPLYLGLTRRGAPAEWLRTGR